MKLQFPEKFVNLVQNFPKFLIKKLETSSYYIP